MKKVPLALLAFFCPIGTFALANVADFKTTSNVSNTQTVSITKNTNTNTKSSADFKTISSAAELRQMPTTGMTNAQPTQAQIAGFIKNNPTDIFNENIKTVYSSQGSITNPYSPFSLYSSVIEDGVRELNIARYIAGVPCHITTTDEYNQVAARAAMICAINQQISHTPYRPSGMDESTYKDAYYACNSSNLGIHINLADAVVRGWLYDGGLENISHVGHRLWCLSPNLEQVGFGMAKDGNSHYCAQHVKSRSQKLSIYDENITVAWPAVNTPYDEIRSGTPFSFFIQSDAMKVKLGSEVSVYMLDRKTNRLYTWHIKQGSLKNSDGLAFVNNLADTKVVIWRPVGWEKHSFNAGDEFDVYIAGYYVDGKPYPVKYTIRFFDPKKVTPDMNTASSEANYKKKAAYQTLFIHGWDRSILTTSYRSHTFDLSECIFDKGHYLVQFQYSKGGNALRLKNAVLKVDGKTVATFSKEVSAGTKPGYFNYEFDITSAPKQSVTLTADICSDGACNSEGTIQISRKGDPTSVSSVTGSMPGGTVAKESTEKIPQGIVIDKWTAGNMPTSYYSVTWDLSKHIKKTGEYSVVFTHTSGSCKLMCKNAKIVADGVTLATFPNQVSASQTSPSFYYTFKVNSLPKKLTLVADACSAGGIMTNGEISLAYDGQPLSATTTQSTTTAQSGTTISGWKMGEIGTSYQSKTWNLSKYISKPGNYTVTFTYKSGGCMLKSKNATISANMKTIAKFPNEVSAGNSPNSFTYTFNVESQPNTLLLSADVCTVGGLNSNGDITIVRNGDVTSTANSTTTSSSTSSSAATGKTKWEQPSAPINVPNELIIYNKGAQNVATTATKEVVPFNSTPKIVEYTTGRIQRPTEYLQRYSYPTNTAARTVNSSATRNDRVEGGVLYIAEGTTTIYKNAYNGRADITKVYLPASVKVIGDYAFANMPNLQTVESAVRNSYQSVRYIGDHAFDQDMRLTTFPELSDLEYLGVCAFREVGLEKTRVQAYFVADSAFLGSALKSVGWTSVIAIGDYAFKDCQQLSEWNFVDNPFLEYVGHGAFLGTSLNDVDLREGINVGIQAFENNTAITWRVSQNRTPQENVVLKVPKMKRETYSKVMTDVNDFSIYMPESYDPVKSVDVPLVLYLHGRSMCQDLPPAPEYGPAVAMLDGNRIFHDKPVLLVCPSGVSEEGWSSAKLHKLYEFLKAHYAFDHKQFYIIGMSMGGWGTLNYVNRYSDEVAACVAMCGGCDAKSPCGLNKVPTWIIHAEDDDVTSVTYSDQVVSAMKQCGSTDLLQYSRLKEGGHSLIQYFTYSNMYDWLFSHTSNVRKFNRSIDFVATPDFDIDELHYNLGGDFDYFITEDIDITSSQLNKIKQRTPNAQGTKYVTAPVETTSSSATVVPITVIKLDD